MCVDRRVRGCGVGCPHCGCAVCVLTGVYVAVVFAVLTVAVCVLTGVYVAVVFAVLTVAVLCVC